VTDGAIAIGVTDDGLVFGLDSQRRPTTWKYVNGTR
jgi:hypothetical protein